MIARKPVFASSATSATLIWGATLTPEGWHPGDDVLLPPATAPGGDLDADWFCKRVADR